MYLGFCIAALVGCCEEHSSTNSTDSTPSTELSSATLNSTSSTSSVIPDSGPRSIAPHTISKKVSYIAQLEAVVLGKGAKSQRRLTIRSRLRAAFALQLISITALNSRQRQKDGHHAVDFNGLSRDIFPDLRKMVPFLDCLAELQETRLPCSEDALMEALSHSVKEERESNEGHMQVHAHADARVLVRTWLHDEGSHQEVRTLSVLVRTCDLTTVFTITSLITPCS